MNRSSNVPLDENVELMRRVADDDFEAFEQLHQRYAPLLVYMASRRRLDPNLVDDLVQRIFFSLWQQRKNFRANSSFEAYLFSIAKHTMNKELRRFYKMAERQLKDISESIPDSYMGLSLPEAELYLQELIGAIEAAIAKLPPGQRKALEVSMDGNVPSTKTLKDLGCSYDAFKKRLKRARANMRVLLAPLLNDEDKKNKS